MLRNVTVKFGPLRYAQNISVGPHVFQSDEPTDVGGNDAGPEAHELLMAALGACANITVQMYAERKQWPLQGVQAAVSYARVRAENPADSDAKDGMLGLIDVEIALAGDLSEEQQRRLLEIANKCPVHRLLVSGVQVNTRLLVPASPPH
jgi:putative redox protein